MIPSTVERVSKNTADSLNQKIQCQMKRNIAISADAGGDAIDKRIVELDHEWDVERVLEANAATLMLVGLALGATLSRKWYLFPGVIAAFLLQHAVQGWCPPIPVLRRLGARTATEIDQERYSLKVLRGDFDNVARKHQGKNLIEQVVTAVRQ